MAFSRIGVVGAGAWGVALAIAAERAGREVRLWGRPGGAFAGLAANRRSDKLPGVALPEAVELAAALADLEGCDALLLAAPAQAARATSAALAGRAEDTAAAGDLRQGHRAGHGEIHDAGGRRGRAGVSRSPSCPGRASPSTSRRGCRRR